MGLPLTVNNLLLQSRDVSDPKTTILIGNEERDATLQKALVEELNKHFIVKAIKRKKLCALEGYHELIQVWCCKLKRVKNAITTSATRTSLSANVAEKEGEGSQEGEEKNDADV